MTKQLVMSAISSGQQVSLVPSDTAEEQTVNTDDAANEQMTSSSPQEVLTILSDSYSRSIIAATAEQPVTVSDIVNECDMSTATAYRKVNQLVETGLLEEQVRIRPEGTNLSEFALNIEAVRVVLTQEGGLEVTFSVKPQDTGEVRRLSTDGGVSRGERVDAETAESQSTESSRQQELHKLFLDVTGTDELVEKQDSAIESRYLDDTDDNLVSGYVTNLVRDDGLSDALPASDTQGQR